jgi:CheY-like chemotaxis protein
MGNGYFYTMALERKANILLVDDDADDRFLFTCAVAEIGDGMRCVCVGGTVEALNYLNMADPLPDLIFLDLNMPGYDGKKCLKQLKSTESIQHIPVIIYSTFVSQSDQEEMIGMGADHVITKPGNFDSMQQIIAQSMEAVLPGL